MSKQNIGSEELLTFIENSSNLNKKQVLKLLIVAIDLKKDGK